MAAVDGNKMPVISMTPDTMGRGIRTKLPPADFYTPPASLEQIADQFPQITEIKNGDSLPQTGGLQLFGVNYFKPYIESVNFPEKPHWATAGAEWSEERARAGRVHKEIRSEISRIFEEADVSTSRTTLITLVTGLLSFAAQAEDKYNINCFYDFGKQISLVSGKVLERAVKEAGEVCKWRRVPVATRDLALANKMSDIYHLAELFGAAPFSQRFPEEFGLLWKTYRDTVKADVRESGQSGNKNPGDFLTNGMIAHSFIFGFLLDINVRTMFRGANFSVNPNATYDVGL